jgi:hypothetical protein
MIRGETWKKLVPDHAPKNLGHAHPQNFSKFYFSMIRVETPKKLVPDHAPQKLGPAHPQKFLNFIFPWFVEKQQKTFETTISGGTIAVGGWVLVIIWCLFSRIDTANLTMKIRASHGPIQCKSDNKR